jgi:hypothetical protein
VVAVSEALAVVAIAAEAALAAVPSEEEALVAVVPHRVGNALVEISKYRNIKITKTINYETE